ncbi:MAG: hypothetical protein ACOYN3_01630 [Acidimicrobiia bacterium]
MAKNPDPELKLATNTGVVRTLDDWSTMFHLVLVILPDSPEATQWIPVAERIFAVLGDADCRCAYVMPSTPAIADRVIRDTRAMVFVDPDKELVKGLGLTHLPAFIHLRQDTSMAAAAQGWDSEEWQAVARSIGNAMSWSVPEIANRANPPKTIGYPIS